MSNVWTFVLTAGRGNIIVISLWKCIRSRLAVSFVLSDIIMSIFKVYPAAASARLDPNIGKEDI